MSSVLRRLRKAYLTERKRAILWGKFHVAGLTPGPEGKRLMGEFVRGIEDLDRKRHSG